MSRFTNPRIICEEIEYTGGGCNYLTYGVETLENGKRSVLYGFYVSDYDEVRFMRTGILDPYETKGNEEWCDVPEDLSSSSEFAGIAKEIKENTLALYNGTYERKYPERKYPYDPRAVYETEEGSLFRQVFEVIRKGRPVLFGYRVNPKTGEANYDRAVKIGDTRLRQTVERRNYENDICPASFCP